MNGVFFGGLLRGRLKLGLFDPICPKLEEADEQQSVAEFQRLMCQHQGRIYRIILRNVRDPTLAQDLTQDTFLRAFKSFLNFRGDASFETLLTRIAINVVASYFQSASARTNRTTTALSAKHGIIEPDRIKNTELRAIIGKLSIELRNLIILCYFGGNTIKEAAEILEIPVGTACSRLHTALRKLRELLQEDI